jgi:predicted DNA-binding transcriptional regulator YafY
MSKHGTIRRYALIIEKAGRKMYPSFKEIRDYLFDHGFELSARTIQRDLEQIRYDFGIEIAYDRHHDGYYIDREHSFNLDNFLRFLEIVTTAELLTESLKESRESLNYISFESRGDLRGSENLKPLLFAVRNHRKISFEYEKFQTSSRQRRYVKPYLLKEYMNRWYLVGTTGTTDQLRIYGIDRITSLIVREDTFERQPGLQPAALFDNIIGVTCTDDKPLEVILSFTPLQGKYIKSLPLHHSQEILADSKSELRIRLHIIPNFEFRQRILMLGPAVRVIEPQWLATEVQQSLQAALDRYV